MKTLEQLEPRHLAAVAIFNYDVTGDGIVAPGDVLAIVNYIESSGEAEGEGSNSLDVNHDGHVAPMDALLVTNHQDPPTARNFTTSSLRRNAPFYRDPVPAITRPQPIPGVDFPIRHGYDPPAGDPVWGKVSGPYGTDTLAEVMYAHHSMSSAVLGTNKKSGSTYTNRVSSPLVDELLAKWNAGEELGVDVDSLRTADRISFARSISASGWCSIETPISQNPCNPAYIWTQGRKY